MTVSVDTARCQEILADAFMSQVGGTSTPAFAVLVKRLQESLSRLEGFEVALAGQNSSEGEDHEFDFVYRPLTSRCCS